MKKAETDIVICGSGPSGLTAAVQAAENGAKVVVLEKAQAVGGASNMGMGPLGIGTRFQKQQMIDITVEKAFNMFMEYTHYNVDARLVKRYFEQSAETIEWLESNGVEFEGAFRYFPRSEATWHIVKSDQGIGPRAASFMAKALYEKAQEQSVQFMLQTTAKKIIMETGRVTGVIAVDASGDEVQIACKAAIICNGGAGSNKELIKAETGLEHGENLFSFAVPGLVGDGLRMAWEAGADKLPVRIEMAAAMEGMDDLPQSVSVIMHQPNLLVNKQGKRVMNEDHMQNSTFLSNVAAHQQDKIVFSILDTSIVKYYIRRGVDHVSLVRNNPDVSDFNDGVRIAVENGNKGLFIADSIEDLAEKAGINKERLVKTVEDYNDFCDSTDEEFFKDKRYMRPLIKAPYYCVKIRPGGYGTVGGIRINENCEALNKDFEPITGLYAAGADACNIYDDSYMFLLPGNSMGFAVNTGRIAAISASNFVESLSE
ncbi:MAG: FAD-dependent oxidoreductase [Treponema sp.]|jgi:fumarate reductase flavoprotein subunit|nr:FAD-dependent oxidoreductase [Treponema sp.]